MARLVLLCVALFGGAVQAQTTLDLTEGTNISVDVTPDGSTLVTDVQGTIWTLPAEGGTATAITDIMGDARIPRISPDGSKVVFQSYRDGTFHIWQVNLDGTGLEQLTSGPFDHREPVFGPDGQSIYFSSDRAGSYDIWSLNTETGALSQVTESDNDSSFPAPFEGGFAYLHKDEEGSKVRLAIDGAAQTLHVSADALAGLSANDDGSRLIVVETGFKFSRLVRIDPQSGGTTPISPDTEDVFPFAVAFDGASVLYTANGAIKRWQDSGVDVIPFAAPVVLEPRDYARKAYDFLDTSARPVKGLMDLRTAPDGDAVVFAALGDLWSYSEENGARQLTDDPYVDLSPTVSPNGAALAWVTDREGSMDIWLRNLVTGQERHLPIPNGAAMHLAWSPDGTAIAYLFVESLFGLGNAQIQVIDIETAEVKNVGPVIWGPGRPSWNADGSVLAVSAVDRYAQRFREGVNKIMLIPMDGGEPRFVTPHPNESLQMRGGNGPVWSRDGSRLAYAHAGALWSVDVSSDGTPEGEAVLLLDEIVDHISWSNDGEIIALSTDEVVRVSAISGNVSRFTVDLDWTQSEPGELSRIRAGAMWDGASDSATGPRDILLDDGRIMAIEEPKGRCRRGCLDASEQMIIPGLFDFHTHMSNSYGSDLGRVWLAHGITSVREPGAEPYDALERREAWAAGQRPGPRLFFAGGLTDGERVFYGVAEPITSEVHLEKYMERMTTLGVDMIKTYVRMPDLWQKRVVGIAHANGLPVSSHEIFPAAAYGTDQVEHLSGTSRRGFSPKQSARKIGYGDLAGVLSASGMTITPTLGLEGGYAYIAAQDESLWDHPALVGLTPPQALASSRRFAGFTARDMDGLGARVRNMQDTVARIVEAGARVTAGTDSPFIPYGLSQIVEIQLYAEGAIGNVAALKSATSWAAEAVGSGDQLGRVAPGFVADFALVNGNPVEDITALRNIEGIVKGGAYMSRTSLIGD